ncbi:YceI family protein [Hugenholtzia roseola]|uniref:YceI family protein n=1 Tax=Hugenholtzia roseola TaxID=1002 RepID=UPI0003FD14BB|nr:YceI family protein [Hugenholtzia roseola]
MKKILSLSSLLAVALMAFAFTFKALEYKLDTQASKIHWRGEKVTGFHEGYIAAKSGSFKVEDGKVVGGSFVVDMNAITCTDLEGEYADKLIGHLKSDDFFSVAKFPTSKLELKSVVWQGGDNYKVTAALTIKDVTKEIKFPAVIKHQEGEINATAQLTIDRTDYGVQYGSGSIFNSLGDKVIYDNFDLKINLVGKK